MLVLLCQLLGVISLLVSLHELAFLAPITLVFTAPICMDATPPTASLALATSCTSLTLENVSSLLACVHDQVVPQHVVLHVLDVDARNLLEPQGLFVKQFPGRGVTGELYGQQLRHQTGCPRSRSRVKHQDEPSPGLQNVTFPTVVNDVHCSSCVSAKTSCLARGRRS